jgi:hypothetical protein
MLVLDAKGTPLSIGAEVVGKTNTFAFGHQSQKLMSFWKMALARSQSSIP